MIQAVIIAAVAVSVTLCWRCGHRCGGSSRIEAFRQKAKIVFLVLSVCVLCSKIIVHTYRHFNPPPPPIIGP